MKDIEAILAQCYEEMEGGASLESTLARHQANRQELEPLLCLAMSLREGSHPTPSPRFRRSAIERFLREANMDDRQPVTSSPEPRFHRWIPNLWNRRYAMGAIVSLLLALVLLGGGGATYASADSLPGEALYPMKMAVERFRLIVAQDEMARGQLHMSFADERLEEAIVLADEDPGRLSQCLMAYAGEMEQAMAILAPRAEGDGALATALQERLAFQQRLLSQMPDAGDEGLQERLRATMQLTNRIRVNDGQQEEPPAQEQQGPQENEGLEQQQRTQEQERIQTNQAITATQTVSEAQRIQERQRVQVGNEISSTETMSEPLELQNQERTRLQEQEQNQEQTQDQAQEQQQDQSREQDQGEGSVQDQDQDQQQNQEPEGNGSSHGGKR